MDGIRERAEDRVRGAAGADGGRSDGDAAAAHGVGRRRGAAERRRHGSGHRRRRRPGIHARALRPRHREQGFRVLLHAQPRRHHRAGAQHLLH